MNIPRRRRFPLRQPDHSRLVRANFTGHAVQELPGLVGAFGPLNMAVAPLVGTPAHDHYMNPATIAAERAFLARIRGDQGHQ